MPESPVTADKVLGSDIATEALASKQEVDAAHYRRMQTLDQNRYNTYKVNAEWHDYTAKRLRDLQALVDTLPKTEDGLPIVIDMRVYWYDWATDTVVADTVRGLQVVKLEAEDPHVAVERWSILLRVTDEMPPDELYSDEDELWRAHEQAGWAGA